VSTSTIILKVKAAGTALFVLFFLLLCSCGKKSPVEPAPEPEEGAAVDMVVVSDLHVMDQSLLVSDGSAFQTWIMKDRKLLAQSEAIFDAAIQAVIAENASIVLITGDLTKDGELISHQAVAQGLQDIESSGKKVYVVPGNHDVNNPHALSYSGANMTPVARVPASEFATIYDAFGYGEAIARDPNSLSYVAKPADGIWILAMDACRYSENTTSPVIGGKFSAETAAWIKTKLSEARSQDVQVIGMMHHGLVEHFAGQATLFADYVVEDGNALSSAFADSGLKVVFTGHFHALDIVKKTTSGSNFIFDIETASLVTPPCAFRTVQISDANVMTVKAKPIESVNYNTGSMTFQEYADDFLATGLNVTGPVMIQTLFGLDSATAVMIAPKIIPGMIAHYDGDETPDQAVLNDIQALTAMNAQLGNAVGSLWNDLPPADKNVVIDLNTGSIQ
jgi:3',5'-cyclic AMP phosphodiesterase CpdA